MKIYKDGEYANKSCAKCKTNVGVFYDKKSDLFICSKCLYENEESKEVKK